MVDARVDVTKRNGRKPSMTIWSSYPDLRTCYKAMVRQVTWFTEQGFSANIRVGSLHGLSQLKKAAEAQPTQREPA